MDTKKQALKIRPVKTVEIKDLGSKSEEAPSTTGSHVGAYFAGPVKTGKLKQAGAGQNAVSRSPRE